MVSGQKTVVPDSSTVAADEENTQNTSI